MDTDADRLVLVGPWLVPPDMEEDVGDFMLMDVDRCQCGNPGTMPPCFWCTHPGNTVALLDAGLIIYFGE